MIGHTSKQTEITIYFINIYIDFLKIKTEYHDTGTLGFLEYLENVFTLEYLLDL